MKRPVRILVTGEIGAGKTTFCLQIADQCHQADLELGGVISPGVFEGGRKVGIDAIDLKSGQRRRLAYLRGEKANGPSTKGWSFVKESVAWGNRVLARAAPCDVLIIDELGPLEFERGEGWVEGVSLVDEGDYEVAFVVVRLHLLNQALERWPDSDTINLASEDNIHHLANETFQCLVDD